jgi:hypothetical protein
LASTRAAPCAPAVQRAGRRRLVETGIEAQPHEFGAVRRVARHRLDRLVDQQHLVEVAAGGQFGRVEGLRQRPAAALLPPPAARVFDQDAAHGDRGAHAEAQRVLGLRVAGRAQPQERLVDQRRRLQRLHPGLAREQDLRQAAQLLVGGEELLVEARTSALHRGRQGIFGHSLRGAMRDRAAIYHRHSAPPRGAVTGARRCSCSRSAAAPGSSPAR